MSNSNPTALGQAPPAITFAVGGNVQAKRGFYVSRRTDAELLAHCREANFAYVLAPRQLGKTSLVIRTSQQLSKEGILSAIIDLSPIGKRTAVEKEWYLSLLGDVVDQLDLDVDIDEWWERHSTRGASKALILFFREVLLRQMPQPVVIFLDEIDSTITLEFKDDFFAALRYIYNARAFTPEFARLSFVLIGVATPSDLISEAHRTPYNVGQRIDLSDFTPEEAAPLAAGLGAPPDEARQLLGWVLKWTKGHPYLTMRLCRLVTESGRAEWSEAAVDELVADAFFGKIEKDLNLQFVRDMLTVRVPPGVPLAEVLTTFKELRRRHIRADNRSRVQTHLKLSGVAREEGSNLVVRNPIYREVFDDKWIGKHRPESWIQTQYQQARRVSALLFAVAIVLLALLALAGYQWREARKHKQSAEAARVVAERAASAAELAASEATAARYEAERQRAEAERQRELAEEGRRKEEVAKAQAQRAAREAQEQRQNAVRQSELASAARQEAERQRALAERASVEARAERDKAKEAEAEALEAERRAVESRELADKRSQTDRLYRDAVDLLQRGDKEAARKKFNEALGHYEHLSDLQGQAITLRNIANSFVDSFMPTGDEAKEYYERALNSYARLASAADADTKAAGVNGQATTLLLRGALFEEQAHMAEARADFTRAAGIFEGNKDPFGQGQALTKLAETYYDVDDFGRLEPSKSDLVSAKSYLEQALKVYEAPGRTEEEGKTLRSGEGRTLQSLIRIAEKDPDLKGMIPVYYARLLDFYEKTQNTASASGTLGKLLYLAHGAGNTKLLNEYYDKLLELYEQTALTENTPVARSGAAPTSRVDVSRLDSLIVAVYDSLDEGRRGKTSEMFGRSLSRYRGTSDYANMGRVYEVQGRIQYYADKDKKVALDKYREALDIYNAHGLTLEASRTLQYMGHLQYVSGRKDEARESYERALQLLLPKQSGGTAEGAASPPRAERDDSTISELMMGLAELNHSTGRSREALRYYREVLARMQQSSRTLNSEYSRMLDVIWSIGVLTAQLEGEAAADKFYEETLAPLRASDSGAYSYVYPGLVSNLAALFFTAGDRQRVAYFLEKKASFYLTMKLASVNPIYGTPVYGLSDTAASYKQLGAEQKGVELLDKAYALYNAPRARPDGYTLPSIIANFKSMGDWERASDMYFKFKLRAAFADKEELPDPSDDLMDDTR